MIEKHLSEYFDHDLVLMPFFFDDVTLQRKPGLNHNHVYFEQEGEMQTLCGCSDEKRAVLVSAKVLDNQVDLFDKCERENDNQDISNTVLHAMELASGLQKIELNEELIDAEMENIP
jgi:hypothetical protein